MTFWPKISFPRRPRNSRKRTRNVKIPSLLLCTIFRARVSFIFVVRLVPIVRAVPLIIRSISTSARSPLLFMTYMEEGLRLLLLGTLFALDAFENRSVELLVCAMLAFAEALQRVEGPVLTLVVLECRLFRRLTQDYFEPSRRLSLALKSWELRHILVIRVRLVLFIVAFIGGICVCVPGDSRPASRIRRNAVPRLRPDSVVVTPVASCSWSVSSVARPSSPFPFPRSLFGLVAPPVLSVLMTLVLNVLTQERRKNVLLTRRVRRRWQRYI